MLPGAEETGNEPAESGGRGDRGAPVQDAIGEYVSFHVRPTP